VRPATREEVLAFPEAAPIGPAKTGLITVPVEPTDDASATMDEPGPIAETASPVAEEAPSPAAEEASPVVATAPAPVIEAAPAPVVEAAPMPAAETAPIARLPRICPRRWPTCPRPARCRTRFWFTPKPADLQPLAPQAPKDVQPTNDEPTLYVVQTGDNLTRLSARFGTTIPAILAANKIASPNLVFVGQSLIIPSAAPKPDVVESPTPPAPTANTAPEPIADAPDAEVATTYTVKTGDSAITIARQLGVNVDDLLTANGVVNRNRVYVGQVLTVPEGRGLESQTGAGKERLVGHARGGKGLGAALLAVDDHQHFQDLGAGLAQRFDGAERGASGGHHVLDDDHFFARLEHAFDLFRGAVLLGLVNAHDQHGQHRWPAPPR